MMDRQPTATSPMSVATEPPARLSEDVSSDVVATRHLRLILESITADKNLSEEERKRKISNFGAALMASAETKAPIEKKPEIQTRTSATTVYSPQSKDDIMKMELVKAVFLANAEKSKIPPPLNERKEPQTTATTSIASSAAISLPQQPKPATVPKPEMQTHSSVPKPEMQTYSSTASFTSSPVPKPEMQTYSSVPKPEMQAYSSTASFTSSPSRKPNDKPEFNRATSAASVTSGASISLPQPKSNTKKKKGWLSRKLTGKKNRDEVRGDFDQRDYSGRNSDRDPAEVYYSFSEVGSNEVADESPMYGIQEEPYDGVIRGTGSNISAHSDESDRSIGTFEQDYINDIIRDQMKEKHLEEFEGVLSEGTFEQDARALSALSEGTFEQDARALEAEHTSAVFVPRELGVRQELGVEPNLSETTFEQDAMRDGDDRNDEKIGTAESDLSDGSFGSETTFERDMRKKTTRRTADAPTTEIFEAPSLESVTTFEKEARGREAVASRSRSFGPQMDDYSEEEEASECSDTFMQDIVAQEMRPTQPAPQPVWETTAAPGPVPKISELQVQLSPANISKGSIGKRFFSKFTCHCA